MKNKVKKYCNLALMVGIVTIIFTLFSGKIARAEDETQAVDFSIQAILPENQIDKNNTYFDLKMEPNQKQTIEVLIKNTGDKEESYTLSINQAYTNAQGFIDYNDKNVKLDDSLKYPIDDLVTYDKEVTIPAQSSKKVPIVIQMPDESFDGQIMAGIQVTKKQENDEGRISNKVGYILGLTLRETDNEIKRDLQLISVAPKAFNGSTSVQIKLKNPTMDAIGHLKYVVNITDKKTKKNVRSVTYDSDMQMAPNSIYDFSVEWEGRKLVAGDYKLDLIVSDAKGNKWPFKTDFIITEKQAKNINDATVDFTSKKPIPVWVYLLIVIVILILIVLAIVFYKNRKQKIESKKRLALRRKKKKGLEKNRKQNKEASQGNLKNKS